MLCERTTFMPLTIDGLSIVEFESLTDEELDAFVFCGRPISFRIGSADILGQFESFGDRVWLEFAHIDGGGEGALPLILRLASSYAKSRGIRSFDWFVHAVNCARPNLKLRRFLERRGFKIVDRNGVDVFHLHQTVAD